MRTLRLSFAGMAILALVGSLPVAVLAQSDGNVDVQPPMQFSGTLTCSDDHQPGLTKPVRLGPYGDGSLIRRETRGSVMRPIVEEMSDPRLDGTYTLYGNTDEYTYPGMEDGGYPLLATVLVRIENDAGAWQGSGAEPYLPDIPQPEWAIAVLTGEGAYEGFTAVMGNTYVDEPCGWEVQGLIFQGEMPPVPSPSDPTTE